MDSPENQFAVDLCAFIDASPSPYHAVDEAARRLVAAGFEELGADAAGSASGPSFVRTGGALVAFSGRPGAPGGFRVVGAHTDSPNLRLKPQADRADEGWQRLGVEVYGGALNNSWLDRDLGCSGRLAVRGPDGPCEVLVRLDRPVARIPQLAIHLDRQVNQKGLVLNRQRHLVPVTGIADGPGLVEAMAGSAGVDPDAVLSHDLMLHDLTPSTLAGLRDEFVSAPRLDNLASCHAAIEAMAAAHDHDAPVNQVVVLYDHEEVGSTSTTGASAPLLLRLLQARSGSAEAFAEVSDRSLVMSADGAHGTHPNYPDRHDPDHRVTLNGGPVLKFNANERYATDATGAAEVRLAAERAGVPLQAFVSRSDLACGSTIGPLTAAAVGIRTVDLGIAQLAMHSAREFCGSADPVRLKHLLAELLAGG